MTPLLVTTCGQISLAAPEHFQRGRVLRARTHQRGQPLDGFQVVVENLGAGVEHGFQTIALRVEIRHEHLDDDARVHRAHRADRLREVVRAAVPQVVPRDGGDDDVFEPEPLDGLGHALGFVDLQREGLGRGHRAKTAGARAAFPGDHEGGGALAPAFPAVGALRALADGVQLQVGDEGLGGKEDGVGRQPHLDPVRLLVDVQGGIDLRKVRGHGRGKYAGRRERMQILPPREGLPSGKIRRHGPPPSLRKPENDPPTWSRRSVCSNTSNVRRKCGSNPWLVWPADAHEVDPGTTFRSNAHASGLRPHLISDHPELQRWVLRLRWGPLSIAPARAAAHTIERFHAAARSRLSRSTADGRRGLF